jgi:potassium/chloride transporter 9
MGVIGSAKLLQALARDHLVPGLSIFGQGTAKADEPTYAIFITYIVAQLTMLSDINQIASFITMTYLMTFLVTNLACFLLKISSAPNFRPSFHYFNWLTAAIGTVASGATMFFVDGFYASACVAILMIIFLLIHYTTPPKPWGDVSQSLIYHQVRKYLLRLRQEHVKFWRPQILLFVNDPRRQFKLIQFCNSLKKGALFVLGHVIVTQDFGGAVPEARRQQTAWTKYIDFSKVKAFINIAISPAVEWGARNIVLSAGLGGMRPNIVVMGFYNLGELRETNPLIEIPSPQHSRPPTARDSHEAAPGRTKGATDAKPHGRLPTDAMRRENAISVQSYVTILEDLLLRLQINVAVAKGFQDLEMPGPKPSRVERLFSSLRFGGDGEDEGPKKYIDMWPIQMSAEISTGGEGSSSRRNVLTTNFDTYTLILQLGCILNTVPSWKRAYRLRVAVFVEYESDVEEERGRVSTLLTNLRIQAEVLVFWLACGDLRTYEVIINGNTEGDYAEAATQIDEVLMEEEWWQDVQNVRGKTGSMSASQELVQVEDLLGAVTSWPMSSFVHGRSESKAKRFEGLKKMLRRTKRKASISDISQLGVGVGMRTHRLPADLVDGHSSGSESSSSDEHCDEDAVDTGSEELTASENDLSEYDLDASDDEERPITPVRRTKSMGASMRLPLLAERFNLRKFRDKGSQSGTSEVTPLRPHPDTTASDTALIGGAPKPTPSASSLRSSVQTPRTSTQKSNSSSRSPKTRHRCMPKFSSKPVPRTTIATEDGSGPSIMFTDQPSPDRGPGKGSIYDHASPSPHTEPTDPFTNQAASRKSAQATGFPLPSSLPLSFNDLPCRAQHLILNELMRTHSGSNTAVLFTTLPSPLEGTCESEADSVRYLGDLEVLCQDLPPALLVHSNSMTVTMNL